MKELPKVGLAIDELKDVAEAMSNLAKSKSDNILKERELSIKEKEKLQKKCDILDSASKDMVGGIDRMIEKLTKIVEKNGKSDDNN